MCTSFTSCFVVFLIPSFPQYFLLFFTFFFDPLILYSDRFLLPQHFSSLLRILLLLSSYMCLYVCSSSIPTFFPIDLHFFNLVFYFLPSLCLPFLTPAYIYIYILISFSYLLCACFIPLMSFIFFLHLLVSYVSNLSSLYSSLLLRVFLCSGFLYAFLSLFRMRFSSSFFYEFLLYFFFFSFCFLPSFFVCFSLYPLILYYRRTDCFRRHRHSRK